MKLRPSTLADSPALAALLSAAGTRHAGTAEQLESFMRHVLEHPAKPHFYGVAAEDAGQILGVLMLWQDGGRFDPQLYQAELAVHPAAQGRGLGRRLAALAQEHLQARGAREVLAGTYETNARGLEFLARQGFTGQFRYFDNVLELGEWDAQSWPIPPLPDGLRIMTLKELIAEQGEEAAWRAFHAAFAEVREDVPSQMPPSPMPYGVFRRRSAQPGFLAQGVFLAVTDAGEVAALTELRRDPGDPRQLSIGLTGTRRAWRRRGLALALKLAGMHWAQAQGAARIKTGNASSNAPMLALNDALGFRPTRVWVETVRRLEE